MSQFMDVSPPPLLSALIDLSSHETLSLSLTHTHIALFGCFFYLLIRGLLLGGDFSQLAIQLIGIGCVGAFTCAFSFLVWNLLRATTGLRVSKRDEISGLDDSEHGQQAYHLTA